MHKATIVRIGCIGLLLFFGCKAKIENDTELLKLVLNDLRYEKKDSIFLTEMTNNTSAINFFKFRNIEEFGFTYANKDGSPILVDDSLFFEYDTIIYKPLLVRNDNYLMRGKGVSERSERFLKDSFNYKIDSLKWDFSLKDYPIFNAHELQHGSPLMISKPVYNLSNTKAIVFKSLRSKNRKLIGERAIYLFQKNGNEWDLVFEQKERKD